MAALLVGGQRGYLVVNSRCSHDSPVPRDCSERFSALGSVGTLQANVTCNWPKNSTPRNAEVVWTGNALVCSGGWGGGECSLSADSPSPSGMPSLSPSSCPLWSKAELAIDFTRGTSSIETGAARLPQWGCLPAKRDLEAGTFGVIPGSFTVTSQGLTSASLLGTCQSTTGATGSLTGQIDWVTGTTSFSLSVRSNSPFNLDITEAVAGVGNFDGDHTATGTANFTLDCVNKVGFICYKFGYQPTSIRTTGTVPWTITFSR